jgi:tRNA (mo5U34)-methyltransferase
MQTDIETRRTRARKAIERVPVWHHRIELAPGVVTPGDQDTPSVLARLPLPADLRGRRALDVGARDGFFSFELERRGADVLALDYTPPEATGFSAAATTLGSKVAYVTDNIYALTPPRYGRFDLVLFLGVLYHLRHPLLALDRLWDVMAPGGLLIVETEMLDGGLVDEAGQRHALADLNPHLPGFRLAQFHPGRGLNGDFTNQWVPSKECLGGLLEAAGFRVTDTWAEGSRGGAVAHRGERDPDDQRRTDEARTLGGRGGALVAMARRQRLRLSFEARRGRLGVQRRLRAGRGGGTDATSH